jgi:chromosome segregation ATPase
MGLLQDARDSLHKKLQLRQQETAAKREEVARLRKETIRASANGEANAGRLQDRLDRASRDLEIAEAAIELLQTEVAEADRKLEGSQKQVEEATERVSAAYAGFRDVFETYIQALEEFIRKADPVGVQLAMQEVQRAEGDAARRAGNQLVGNTAVEMLFINRPLLWEATSGLAQYQVVNQLR